MKYGKILIVILLFLVAMTLIANADTTITDEELTTGGNVTSDYVFANGSFMTGVCHSNGDNCTASGGGGGNASWNQSFANSLYITIGNESTFNQTYQDFSYNMTDGTGLNADQSVNTTDSVVFNNITTTNNLTIKGDSEFDGNFRVGTGSFPLSGVFKGLSPYYFSNLLTVEKGISIVGGNIIILNESGASTTGYFMGAQGVRARVTGGSYGINPYFSPYIDGASTYLGPNATSNNTARMFVFDTSADELWVNGIRVTQASDTLGGSFKVKNVIISQLVNSTDGNILRLNTSLLNFTSANGFTLDITNLRVVNANITNVLSDKANITDLEVHNANFTGNVNVTDAEVFGEILGAMSPNTMSCDDKCNALDGIPSGYDWSCVDAIILSSNGATTCSATGVGNKNCVCQAV